MMLLFLTALAAFGVLSNAVKEPPCLPIEPDYCLTEFRKLNFPESEEALNNNCPIALSGFKCMIDFKVKCGIRYTDPLYGKLDAIYDVLVQICDTTSELHQELSTHLPCLGEANRWHQKPCRRLVPETKKEIFDEHSLGRYNRIPGGSSEFRTRNHCLLGAVYMYCSLASISVKCGEATKDLAEEFLDRVGYLDAFCPGEIHEEFKESLSPVYSQMEAELANILRDTDA